MSICRLSALRTLLIAALSCQLLSACSVSGTYPDATQADAAKLRFVANASNVTLDYFDAEHCFGQTTGVLNNFLMVDSGRRVGMSVAPPADARGYLEIKLKPGKEALLRVNSNAPSGLCGIGVNLTPQPGAEYELRFNSESGGCSMLLERIKRIDGKDLRFPMSMPEGNLQACTGSNPIFPKPLPETPQRRVLIERLVGNTLELATKLNASAQRVPQAARPSVQAQIAERRQALGITVLPEAYWTQYRDNLERYALDTQGISAQLLAQFKDTYWRGFSMASDRQLEDWTQPTTRQARGDLQALQERLTRYYYRTRRNIELEQLDQHLLRMTQLDRQYNVCARFPGCWTY